MNTSPPPKDIFDYLTAGTPILIALFVAFVAFWQLKVNRDKLRLDLYNRRFDIYSRTVDFYQAVTSYTHETPKEQFNMISKAFIKGERESQFLFDDESGIHALLEEIDKKSYKILSFKEYGKELRDCQEEFQKMHKEAAAAQEWLNNVFPKLENAMAPYLDFHESWFTKVFLRIKICSSGRLKKVWQTIKSYVKDRLSACRNKKHVS